MQWFAVRYTHNDVFDQREPYTEWRFEVAFQSRLVTENGVTEIETPNILQVRLIAAWAVMDGARTAITANGETWDRYADKVSSWFADRVRDDYDGIRASVMAACVSHFAGLKGVTRPAEIV